MKQLQLQSITGLKDYVEKLSNKRTKVEIRLEKDYPALFRHEIEDYKKARRWRYDPEYPKTWQMQELYRDAVKGDGHLRAIIRNRRLRVTNKRYVIRDPDGIIDEDRTKLITKAWFKKTLRLAHESNYYGYSLIWPSKFNGKEIADVKLIPRGHCIPETGKIVFSVYDDDGMDYREIPEQIWEATLGDDNIGLLETASALTIFKRHSWANWDEWEQIFGRPLRIAYTSGDETHKKKVANWLLKMGRAAFGVFTKDVDKVEMVETKYQDSYNVFNKKREAVNEELSKLINGQTMTVDQGSSRSQGEVHMKTEDQITEDDHDNTLMWCNDTLVPALRFFGYDIPDSYTIDIEEASNPSEKIKIDEVLMKDSGYRFTKDYLETMYDVELEDVKDQGVSSGKKHWTGINSLITLSNLYDHLCCTSTGIPAFSKGDTGLINVDINRLVKDVLDKRLESGSIDKELYTLYYKTFTEGVREGFGKASTALGSPNEKILQELRLNVATFSAFKNHSFVDKLVGLMTDETGKLRSRADFISKATSLDKTYNKRWFQVEYDMVVGKSRAGVQWNAMQARKHLYPNVKRHEIIDKRTRASHIILNGLIISLDDKVLDTHWAPDAPGCRGWMTQTSEAVDHKGINFDDLNSDITPWNINPGKFGKVVDDTHPYYKVNKFEDIARKAYGAMLHEQKREILQYFKGKGSFTIKAKDGKQISISRSRIEYAVNHVSKNKWYRNELFFNIEEVIKKAEYVGQQEVIPGKHIEAKAFHLYKITVHDRTWYIKVKELKETQEYLLNTISDSKGGKK